MPMFRCVSNDNAEDNETAPPDDDDGGGVGVNIEVEGGRWRRPVARTPAEADGGRMTVTLRYLTSPFL